MIVNYYSGYAVWITVSHLAESATTVHPTMPELSLYAVSVLKMQARRPSQTILITVIL